MTGLIVHEWIERVGGAERVLDAFADLAPEADIYCLWDDAPGRYPRRVIESPLSRTPVRGKKALAMPFMPHVWRELRVGEYDWSLISSHLFAHHAQVAGVTAERKFVYVHTPARYLWEPELDGRASSWYLRAVAPTFRTIDRHAARRNRNVAANSKFVRNRIRRVWDTDATVIYPPVDISRLSRRGDWRDALSATEAATFQALPGTYILGASRFVPYKALDRVIDAGAAAGVPVVLAGSGPDETRLRAYAAESSTPVIFVSRPSDEMVAALMQHALVYVFPAVEDFGIMPVEAMALGTPVVVNAVGGASESMLEDVTGVSVHDFSHESLASAVTAASRLSGLACRERAREFSTNRFTSEIRDWMSLSLQPA
ncbi:glycosyltransferase [Leucobacter aridicollis]|nr:glycosyltransferase [Leucobacter aridicollis]